MSPLLYLVTSRMFKDIDRTGLIGDVGGVLWDEIKKYSAN